MLLPIVTAHYLNTFISLHAPTDRQSSHSGRLEPGRRNNCTQCAAPRGGACAQCNPRGTCTQCAPPPPQRTFHSVAPGYHRYERTQRPDTDYFACNCTQCRNLGTSMDICCQCCACAAAAVPQNKPSRPYNVRSVALRGENQETLEVCITNDDCNEEDEIDDIALAHREAGEYHSCYRPPPTHCVNCPPPCRREYKDTSYSNINLVVQIKRKISSRKKI